MRAMINSFKYAIRGISDALKSEPNLKIHFLLGSAAIILALFLKLSYTQLAILVITIFSVIAMELINTVIEKVMDIVSPEKSEKVRLIKDISAAMVLISAIAAILIGLLLFIPEFSSM